MVLPVLPRKSVTYAPRENWLFFLSRYFPDIFPKRIAYTVLSSGPEGPPLQLTYTGGIQVGKRAKELNTELIRIRLDQRKNHLAQELGTQALITKWPLASTAENESIRLIDIPRKLSI